MRALLLLLAIFAVSGRAAGQDSSTAAMSGWQQATGWSEVGSVQMDPSAPEKLGKKEDAKVLNERAAWYSKLWSPEVGFMRGKNADGTWESPDFDQFAWGHGYVEGGPWQCSWAVQHDMAGLAELFGGPDKMAEKLDQLFSMEPTYHQGSYGGIIHEMREMPPCKMGQCAMGNQPSFHVPYMYVAAGQPWKTEYWTRFACTELFSWKPKGFPGDEDNGSTASWYILSAMGFYPLTPGRPEYVLTSPLFKKVTIHLPGGKNFVVDSPENTAEKVYTKERMLNGKKYTNTWISHADIVNGGELKVETNEKPAVRTVNPSELPYSMSLPSR